MSFLSGCELFCEKTNSSWSGNGLLQDSSSWPASLWQHVRTTASSNVDHELTRSSSSVTPHVPSSSSSSSSNRHKVFSQSPNSIAQTTQPARNWQRPLPGDQLIADLFHALKGIPSATFTLAESHKVCVIQLLSISAQSSLSRFLLRFRYCFVIRSLVNHALESLASVHRVSVGDEQTLSDDDLIGGNESSISSTETAGHDENTIGVPSHDQSTDALVLAIERVLLFIDTSLDSIQQRYVSYLQQSSSSPTISAHLSILSRQIASLWKDTHIHREMIHWIFHLLANEELIAISEEQWTQFSYANDSLKHSSAFLSWQVPSESSSTATAPIDRVIDYYFQPFVWQMFFPQRWDLLIMLSGQLTIAMRTATMVRSHDRLSLFASGRGRDDLTEASGSRIANEFLRAIVLYSICARVSTPLEQSLRHPPPLLSSFPVSEELDPSVPYSHVDEREWMYWSRERFAQHKRSRARQEKARARRQRVMDILLGISADQLLSVTATESSRVYSTQDIMQSVEKAMLCCYWTWARLSLSERTLKRSQAIDRTVAEVRVEQEEHEQQTRRDAERKAIEEQFFDSLRIFRGMDPLAQLFESLSPLANENLNDVEEDFLKDIFVRMTRSPLVNIVDHSTPAVTAGAGGIRREGERNVTAASSTATSITKARRISSQEQMPSQRTQLQSQPTDPLSGLAHPQSSTSTTMITATSSTSAIALTSAIGETRTVSRSLYIDAAKSIVRKYEPLFDDVQRKQAKAVWQIRRLKRLKTAREQLRSIYADKRCDVYLNVIVDNSGINNLNPLPSDELKSESVFASIEDHVKRLTQGESDGTAAQRTASAKSTADEESKRLTPDKQKSKLFVASNDNSDEVTDPKSDPPLEFLKASEPMLNATPTVASLPIKAVPLESISIIPSSNESNSLSIAANDDESANDIAGAADSLTCDPGAIVSETSTAPLESKPESQSTAVEVTIRDDVLRKAALLIGSSSSSSPFTVASAQRDVVVRLLCADLRVSILLIGCEHGAVRMRVMKGLDGSTRSLQRLDECFLPTHSFVLPNVIIQNLSCHALLSSFAERLNRQSLRHTLQYSELDSHFRVMEEWFLPSMHSCFLLDLANRLMEQHPLINEQAYLLNVQRRAHRSSSTTTSSFSSSSSEEFKLWTEWSLREAVVDIQLESLTELAQKFASCIQFAIDSVASPPREASLEFVFQREALLTGCYKWYLLLLPLELNTLSIAYRPPFPMSVLFRDVPTVSNFTQRCLEINTLSAAMRIVNTQWKSTRQTLFPHTRRETSTGRYLRELSVLMHFTSHWIGCLQRYFVERFMSLYKKCVQELHTSANRGAQRVSIDYVIYCIGELCASLQSSSLSLTPGEQRLLFRSARSSQSSSHERKNVHILEENLLLAGDWVLFRRSVFLLIDDLRHVCAALLSLSIEGNTALLPDSAASNDWVLLKYASVKAHVDDVLQKASLVEDSRYKGHARSLMTYFQ